MAPESAARLEAQEDVFEANHRKYVRNVVYGVIVAAGVTVFLLIPLFIPIPGSSLLGNPSYLAMLGLSLFSIFSTNLVAYRFLTLHVRFHADDESFQPISTVGRGRKALFRGPLPPVRYDQVEKAVYESVWDEPDLKPGTLGRWWIWMRLKDGSEVWVHDDAEIPEEAYRFLLDQLRCRNIPMARDE